MRSSSSSSLVLLAAAAAALCGGAAAQKSARGLFSFTDVLYSNVEQYVRLNNDPEWVADVEIDAADYPREADMLEYAPLEDAQRSAERRQAPAFQQGMTQWEQDEAAEKAGLERQAQEAAAAEQLRWFTEFLQNAEAQRQLRDKLKGIQGDVSASNRMTLRSGKRFGAKGGKRYLTKPLVVQFKTKGAARVKKGQRGSVQRTLLPPGQFLEAAAELEETYTAPQGWNSLHGLREDARLSRNPSPARPGACPQNERDLAGPAKDFQCLVHNDWNYYHERARRYRIKRVLGSPTNVNGEKTSKFESDYVRTPGWGHGFDHAGHIRARSLGGDRAPINMWPQGVVSNTLGNWRCAERRVKRAIRKQACHAQPGLIEIDILYAYANNAAVRPSGGEYSFRTTDAACAAAAGWTQNAWITHDFLNSECGDHPDE